MAAKLFVTRDAIASIRKAHETFTHVRVDRSYASLRPSFFRSEKLGVEPLYVFAPWEPVSLAQLERWRSGGGVLIDRSSVPDKAGQSDVAILLEAPFSLTRITRTAAVTHEQVVIVLPHVWQVHEEAIDARTPSTEALQEIWKCCRGQRMTDLELSEATGIPRSRLQYMRAGLKPTKEWEMKAQLAPDAPGLMEAWKWINAVHGAGCSATRKDVRLAGHQAAVKQLARLGHIKLTQFFCYGTAEPNWAKLARKRGEALEGLAAVRALVESLPECSTAEGNGTKLHRSDT